MKKDRRKIIYLFGRLARKQIALDGKHLSSCRGNETIDLTRVLLDLSGVKHTLQTAGFLRKLEQALPLIFGERGLLESGTAGVLGFALRLPGGNFLLFTSE